MELYTVSTTNREKDTELLTLFLCNCSHLTSTFASNFQEWALWQQLMVFTLNIFIFKYEVAKIKEKLKCRCYVLTFTPSSILASTLSFLTKGSVERPPSHLPSHSPTIPPTDLNIRRVEVVLRHQGGAEVVARESHPVGLHVT